MTIAAGYNPRFTAHDALGIPLTGAKLYTYITGTTTPKTTWTDYTKATPNTNPIILDSNGEADVWLDGVYRLKLLDADDVVLWTKDNMGSESSALLTSFLALVTVADRLPYLSGVDTFSLATFTAFARSLMDDGDAQTVRNTLNVLNRVLAEITATATAAVPDVYTASLTPHITGTYTTGAYFFITFTDANTTATPTINIDSLGAKTIKSQGGGALIAGEIRAGSHIILKYNGTDMIIINQAPTDSAAAVGSARTIGTGALQACAGNDGRLLSRCQLFTAGGTWTRPSGVTTVRVVMVGGGGGGGGSGGGYYSNYAGGGGGGRGCEAEFLVTVSGDVTVYVGGGGAGGAAGGVGAGSAGATGGTSKFGAGVAEASGGTGGAGGSDTTGGARGVSGSASGTATEVRTRKVHGLVGGNGSFYGPEYGVGGDGGGNSTLDGITFGNKGYGGIGATANAGGGAAGEAGADGYVLVMW